MSAALAWAHGGPPLQAKIRVEPEDFVVEEVLGYSADGEGEHVLLEIRKRDANTAWVATELARFAAVPAMAVSYVGRKDRHAVTTQAFSVHLPGRPDPDWQNLGLPGVEILSAQRHRRKLHRGALDGNRFQLRLRAVQGDREAAERVLAALRKHGAPNYFGEQRFGREQHNLAAAEAMFAGRRVRRAERGLLLSAARSALFNAVLHARVAAGNWNQGLEGEVWALAGSRAWFGPQALNDDLAARLQIFDIHPSGPLWGRGENPAAAEVLMLETERIAAQATLAKGLEDAGLRQERRALRLDLRELRWQWQDDTLELAMSLPAGAYATTVVRELAATE